MALVIDLPIGLDQLDAVFTVVDFLENTEELLKDFQPEVSKFLVRKGFFTGPFLREYNKAFDELIVSMVRKQINEHFNFNPEELLLLTDLNFLKLVAEPLFDQTNYQEHKDVI